MTLLSCEDPSNIWELKCGPQICGANKLAGKLELVLLLNEWTSLFSHGTFQRYVFMLSTRFLRTSGNNFNCLTKHGATLSSLNISNRICCSGYDEHACDTWFFLMPETEESISKIDSHKILQEASELWSCN